MDINHHNYQEWALDYIEGNLPPHLCKSFQAFMESHPSIAGEIYALTENMPVLIPEVIVFPYKPELLRLKGPTPLRRVISLLSGAAAALMLVGIFLVLDQPSVPLMTDSNQVNPIEIPETTMPETPAVITQTNSPGHTTPDTTHSQQKSTPLTKPSLNTVDNLANTDNSFNFAGSSGNVTESVHNTPPETVRNLGQPVLAQVIYTPRLVKMTVPDEITLVYPEHVAEVESEPEDTRFNGEITPGLILVQQSLGVLLAPLEQISPIKPYRTDNGKGVEIASIFRIGVRNSN